MSRKHTLRSLRKELRRLPDRNQGLGQDQKACDLKKAFLKEAVKITKKLPDSVFI